MGSCPSCPGCPSCNDCNLVKLKGVKVAGPNKDIRTVLCKFSKAINNELASPDLTSSVILKYNSFMADKQKTLANPDGFDEEDNKILYEFFKSGQKFGSKRKRKRRFSKKTKKGISKKKRKSRRKSR
jgi:hypothetical protein